jgi:hypothetical protein
MPLFNQGSRGSLSRRARLDYYESTVICGLAMLIGEVSKSKIAPDSVARAILFDTALIFLGEFLRGFPGGFSGRKLQELPLSIKFVMARRFLTLYGLSVYFKEYKALFDKSALCVFGGEVIWGLIKWQQIKREDPTRESSIVRGVSQTHVEHNASSLGGRHA